MRNWRVAAAVLLAAALTACLNVQTRLRLFQDGAGTYAEQVEIQKGLMDFALSQGNFASYDELLADALQKAQQELAGVDGVRLLDMQGDATSPSLLRVSLIYAFDSVEKWNAFAASAKKPKISFAAREEKARGKKPALTVWTVGLETSPDALPKKPDGGEAAAPGMPGPDAMGMNLGGFVVTVAGPGPAFETKPLAESEGIKAELTNDGAASFSGGLQAMIKKQNFEASFRGKPLPAAVLAAEKKSAFVEPSDSYRRMLDVLAQRQEKEAVKQAAAQAIADSFFTLRLTVGRNGKAALQTTRVYYGPTSPLFAGREAMLQAFTPGLAGNYRLEVKPVKGEDGRAGVAFVRTREGELPVERLGGLIAVREDGTDKVYVLTVPALLADAAPPANPQATLGRLVLATPDPVTGTNGAKSGPNEASLDLTAAALVEAATLIVRTTPGK